MEQRVDQPQLGRVAEEEPEAEAAAEQRQRHRDHAGADAAGEAAGPEDEAAEREHGHRPARPGERCRDAPAASQQKRAGEIGAKGIAERGPGEDRILRRQVVPVNEGGGVTGVGRPVGPGVVVMRQPGVRRDLHRPRKQVAEQQRHGGDRHR